MVGAEDLPTVIVCKQVGKKRQEPVTKTTPIIETTPAVCRRSLFFFFFLSFLVMGGVKVDPERKSRRSLQCGFRSYPSGGGSTPSVRAHTHGKALGATAVSGYPAHTDSRRGSFRLISAHVCGGVTYYLDPFGLVPATQFSPMT